MTALITHTATVYLDGNERTYIGQDPEAKRAKFLAEKKARTYLRRRRLSVKMENVHKEVCPDCTTTFTVTDLVVPERQEIEGDDYDWLLSSNWNL